MRVDDQDPHERPSERTRRRRGAARVRTPPPPRVGAIRAPPQTTCGLLQASGSRQRHSGRRGARAWRSVRSRSEIVTGGPEPVGSCSQNRAWTCIDRLSEGGGGRSTGPVLGWGREEMVPPQATDLCNLCATQAGNEREQAGMGERDLAYLSYLMSPTFPPERLPKPKVAGSRPVVRSSESPAFTWFSSWSRPPLECGGLRLGAPQDGAGASRTVRETVRGGGSFPLRPLVGAGPIHIRLGPRSVRLRSWSVGQLALASSRSLEDSKSSSPFPVPSFTKV